MRQLTVPGCRIDLVWRRGLTKRAPNGSGPVQGWLHVVFQTPDINAAFKRLKALGTDVTQDKNADHIVDHLTLHDPEVNEIGIAAERRSVLQPCSACRGNRLAMMRALPWNAREEK